MARCWGSHTHSFTNPATKDSQHLGKCRPCWLCYLHWTQRDAEKGWTGGRSAERGCPEGVNVGKVQRAFLQQHKQEIPAQRSHWVKPRVMRALCYSDGENTNESTLFPSLTLEYHGLIYLKIYGMPIHLNGTWLAGGGALEVEEPIFFFFGQSSEM